MDAYRRVVASKDAYAIACIELFSRLWAELDLLIVSDHLLDQPTAMTSVAARSEILRLELTLLIGACDSARWRMLLSAPQRVALESTLQEVLDVLAAFPEEKFWPLVALMQNQLLDAVLEHSAPSLGVLAPQRLRRAGGAPGFRANRPAHQ